MLKCINSPTDFHFYFSNSIVCCFPFLSQNIIDLLMCFRLYFFHLVHWAYTKEKKKRKYNFIYGTQKKARKTKCILLKHLARIRQKRKKKRKSSSSVHHANVRYFVKDWTARKKNNKTTHKYHHIHVDFYLNQNGRHLSIYPHKCIDLQSIRMQWLKISSSFVSLNSQQVYSQQWPKWKRIKIQTSVHIVIRLRTQMHRQLLRENVWLASTSLRLTCVSLLISVLVQDTKSSSKEMKPVLLVKFEFWIYFYLFFIFLFWWRSLKKSVCEHIKWSIDFFLWIW